MPQVKFFFASIPEESLPVILLLPALFTFGFAQERGRKWLLFNAAAFFCTGVIFIVIANTELDLNAQDILKIYFLPAYIVVAVFVGYGVGVIGLLSLRASRRLRLQFMPATIVALLWFLLPASNLSLNYAKASMRGRDSGLVYGEMLMNGIQQGGVLFAGTDSAYAIPMYMKWVEGRRPDISILSFNRLAYDNYAAEMARNAPALGLFTPEDYEEAVTTIAPGIQSDAGDVQGFRNIAHVNGFLTWKLRQRSDPQKPMYYDQGMHVKFLLDFAIPSGLVMELKPTRIESLPADVVAGDSDYWDMLEKRLIGNDKFLNDIDARQKFSKCRANIGALYLHHKMYAEAEMALEQALRFSDRNMEAYAYLALMRREQGADDEAIRIFEEYMRRDPWNTSAHEFAEWLRK
jgi:tetratricopeptide (TPR) repeat protein